jgi:hypothetical protein
MVDTNTLLRFWLLSAASITSLLGTNINGSIYCGDIPDTFDPTLGLAIEISGAGGSSHPEINTITDDRKMVRIWAGANEFLKARVLYNAVNSLIHTATNVDLQTKGYMMRCIEVTSGMDITDPDSGWATVVAFYKLMAR